MGFSAVWVLAAFLASPAASAGLRPVRFTDSPEIRRTRIAEDPEISSRYLNLILSLERQGASFSSIFQSLCAAALAAPEESSLEKARDIFGSLFHWTEEGGKPIFQDREDLALHLIYGGVIEAYQGPGRGEAAGRAKEERDAETPGNFYDLDDLAATLLGAYWTGPAQSAPAEFRERLSRWSDGRKSLARLPALRLGRLPPRRIAGEDQLAQIRQFVQNALAFY